MSAAPEGRRVIVIVGEAVKTGGTRPFEGEGRGGSGQRLARLMGVPIEALRARGDVVLANLFDRPVAKWDARAARRRALEMMDGAEMGGLPVTWILLGRLVVEAFGFALEPLAVREIAGDRWVHVPHPSGRNLYWNDAANRQRAREILADLIGQHVEEETI